jgi:hypothetical protein
MHKGERGVRFKKFGQQDATKYENRGPPRFLAVPSPPDFQILCIYEFTAELL